MKTRKSARDIVVDMLTMWGEWEAVGYDGGMLRETALGRLAHAASAAPCSAFGPALPLGVLIPNEVAETARLVADMRERCNAGERYYRLIRERYVLGQVVAGDAVERAIKWLVDAWIAEHIGSREKAVA